MRLRISPQSNRGYGVGGCVMHSSFNEAADFAAEQHMGQGGMKWDWPGLQ